MNNEISNKPCGCGNCEPMCTTCGRPWIVCKGECGCKKPCCCNKKVNFCEYGRMAHGCIRERTPECPMQAVIPSVVVDSISNLKNLADCFVHVTSINTTFYIDDKHRTMITWAGPVEVDNYDYENNPLGLRSQTVYDFANNRAIYYNKTGGYEIFGLGGNITTTLHLRPNGYSEGAWQQNLSGSVIRESSHESPLIATLWDTTIVGFSDGTTSYTLEEVFNMLEDGADIVFDEIPVGYSNMNTPESTCDGIRLSVRSDNHDSYAEVISHTGATLVYSPDNHAATTGSVCLTKELNSGGILNRYVFSVPGFYGAP